MDLLSGQKGKMTIEGKNVVVGIRIDSLGKELLNWAIVKVADPGDHVIALHVCRDYGSAPRVKPLLDEYLEVYDELCNAKKVELTGQVLTGSSVRKVLVREACNCNAVSVTVGISKGKRTLGHWASVAKYCAKHLPPNTDVFAVHNGKIVFRRSLMNQLPGTKGDPRPSFHLTRNLIISGSHSEFGGSQTLESARYSPRYNNFNCLQKFKTLSSCSLSLFSEDSSEQKPGWPLLRTAAPLTPRSKEARKMSVVKWVLSLPNRSPPDTPQSRTSFSSIDTENLFTREETSSAESSTANSLKNTELIENLDKLFRANPFGWNWFSYDVMRTSTLQFSSDKLIGKGASNCVYKGILRNGEPVAIKVLKSTTKRVQKDFNLEISIMSSIKHKNILPLLGVCVEDNELISVYDFLHRGSLEENLNGNNEEKSLLSSKVRFKIAVGIAEALNYLHNECSRPIIHRDVKSSNILLTNDLEPQLSDFGLAIWGPSSASFVTDNDVVGTFGYLAPEYFMYGKVSDKVDVYSFGVVLLELLSGRKPISSEFDKGQESLVLWSKSRLENGDLRSILDPNLEENIDEIESRRLALAARLCLTRSARLRPTMNQILKILEGEQDEYILENSKDGNLNEGENEGNTDDEVYPNSCARSYLSLALLDVEEDTSPSFISVDQSSRSSCEGYLREIWSRTSSLD